MVPGTPGWQRPRTVFVVVDNDSWILPYAEELVERIQSEFGDSASLCRNHDDIGRGSLAFFLGCTQLAPASVLERNQYNLVVHESDLPRGRGFSPLSWQTLEGSNHIAVCLLEAVEEADAGPVFMREQLHFEGHELNGELREAQGRMTAGMVMRFLAQEAPANPEPQAGAPTWYPKRMPADSALDVDRSIREQFELLRVVDNERYPAFFELRGHRYRLRIDKMP
jgi:methionyl-tRNA formyltransferase